VNTLDRHHSATLDRRRRDEEEARRKEYLVSLLCSFSNLLINPTSGQNLVFSSKWKEESMAAIKRLKLYTYVDGDKILCNHWSVGPGDGSNSLMDTATPIFLEATVFVIYAKPLWTRTGTLPHPSRLPSEVQRQQTWPEGLDTQTKLGNGGFSPIHHISRSIRIWFCWKLRRSEMQRFSNYYSAYQ
jgi:hypothetical protein